MTAKEIIRLTCSEFDSVSDELLDKWIEIARPFVSKKHFGKLYEQALAFLVCHKLVLAGKVENPLGDIGAIGMSFGVSSVSEGGSSISFNTNQSSNLAKDAELALTKYGLQYLSIRRMVVVPIHCSGECE